MSTAIATSEDQHLNQILQNIAVINNVLNATIVSGVGTNKGDGYIGLLNLYELQGKNKTLHVMVKRAPTDEAFRKKFPIQQSFVTEINFYKYVALYFDDLIEGIKFDMAPKCYWTFNEEYKELIVLENLKIDGYDICDRQRPLDGRHVELALEQFAKLHAFSFAVKQKDAKKFDELVEVIGDNMKNWFSQGKMLTTCKELSGIIGARIGDTEQLKRYLKVYDGMRDWLMNYDWRKDRFAVISHSDCWSTNMMFKYETVNGKKQPIQVKLIDYQLSRCSSIIFDISHFLCVCAGSDVWTNLEHYLKLYYTTLRDFASDLGIDITKLLTYEEFKTEFKNKSKYGLLLSPLYIKAMLMEPTEAPSLMDNPIESASLDGFVREIKNQEGYYKRVLFLIDYFYEHGFY